MANNSSDISPNFLAEILRRQDLQQQPQKNMLARLSGMFSPTSTAGILQHQDAYTQHVLQATENGQEPLTRQQFLQRMQQQQQR